MLDDISLITKIHHSMYKVFLLCLGLHSQFCPILYQLCYTSFLLVSSFTLTSLGSLCFALLSE